MSALRGGVNDNPTVHQFCLNTQALRVVNSILYVGMSVGTAVASRDQSLSTGRKKILLSQRGGKLSQNLLILCENMHTFLVKFGCYVNSILYRYNA